MSKPLQDGKRFTAHQLSWQCPWKCTRSLSCELSVGGQVAVLGVEEGNRPSQGDLPPRSSEVLKTTRKEGAVTQAEFEKMLRGVLNEGTA
jgi:hypothetical protein